MSYCLASNSDSVSSVQIIGESTETVIENVGPDSVGNMMNTVLNAQG
jgi:hypothetical protein